ncbi:MAG: hypothetical protein Q9217_006716 [Psora testacea]
MHKSSIPIFTQDVIQAGLSRFRVVIPLYTQCRDAYDQNWRTYVRDVLAASPQLDGLCIQEDLQLTFQEHGKLSLLTDTEETGLQKAVDFRGNFYAVKRRPEREESCWSKGIIHVSIYVRIFERVPLTLVQPHLVMMTLCKFSDPDTQWLSTEWPTYGSLAEQKLLSANEFMIVLRQVLEATACIHEHKIVHRNIVPSNIWIMSREPLKCRLGGFGSSAPLSLLAPEVYSRKSYLPDDYPADIWSIGVTVLRYSLFDRWFMQTSRWSVEPCLKAQVSRPGPSWHILTDSANAMLRFDDLDRPSAKDCLEDIALRKDDAILKPRAEQILENIDFLSRQTRIPNVPPVLLPLIPALSSETPITVDLTETRKALEISPTVWNSVKVRLGLHSEQAQRATLPELATLLGGFSDIISQSGAIYVRNLHQHIESVHLATMSERVGFFHEQFCK